MRADERERLGGRGDATPPPTHRGLRSYAPTRRWTLLLLVIPLLAACESQEAPYPFQQMQDAGAPLSNDTLELTPTPLAAEDGHVDES